MEAQLLRCIEESSAITDWTMVLMTTVLTAFTAALFIWQKNYFNHERRVHEASYKLALFDYRMKIFNNIETFLSVFMREGHPPIDAVVDLRWEARNASFILPDTPLRFVDEIVEKAFDYRKTSIKWEPLRARAAAHEQLSAAETAQCDACVEKMSALEAWFVQQIQDERLKREFAPYLKLPISV